MHLTEHPHAGAVLRSLLAVAVVLVVAALGAFDTLDLKAIDVLFRTRGVEEPQAPIVVVAIGEDSFDALEMTWPWPRATHAELIDKIAAQRPAAIGLDIAFPEASPYGAADDQALVDALRRAGNVVLAAPMTRVDYVNYVKEDLNPPFGELASAASGFGLVNLMVDSDAFVRNAVASYARHGSNIKTFALALYKLAANAGVPAAAVPERHFLINFRGGLGTYHTIPYSRVIRGEVAGDVFSGKIVLVGATSPVLHDLFATPFAPLGDMPGVEIQANTVETMLRGIAIERASWPLKALLVMLAALLATGISRRYRPLPALGIVVALGGVFLAGVYACFVGPGVLLDVVPVPVTLLLTSGSSLLETLLREQHQRATLMRLFSQHVSPEVANEIWRQRDAFLAGGRLRSQKLDATVLFTDLKGFTAVSERMDTSALMEWINDYMGVMAKLVMDHGGVVDDYYGDAIKANFGVPFPRASLAERAQDARQAVSCALAMGRELERLIGVWDSQGLPTVAMRVGICSGEVVAGCVGAAARLKFTTIGDTVNTAARLESYDKSLAEPEVHGNPCRILVSEATHDLVQDAFSCVPIGTLELKGKETAVAVYRVMAGT